MHNPHQHRARVTPRRYRQPEQPRGRAPHALRRLVVKELQMPDRRKPLRHPKQRVLRHQPEHRHRFRVFPPPTNLDNARDERGRRGEGESDAHAEEERDAAVEPGETAGEGDEEAVVEGDGEEHGEHVEHGHRSRGDLEGGGRGDAAVHRARLLEGEGVLLGGGGDDEDAGGPNRRHAKQGFEFFDSVDGAEKPEVGEVLTVGGGFHGELVLFREDGSLVQETGYSCNHLGG